MATQSQELATLRQKHDDAVIEQKETLEKIKKKRLRSQSPKREKLEREYLDVQFQLDVDWHKQLKQTLEAEDDEEMRQCVAVVIKSIDACMTDLRIGDKDPAYFKFADQMRSLKKFKASGSDSDIAEAWTKYRASEGLGGEFHKKDKQLHKQPFRRGGAGRSEGGGSAFYSPSVGSAGGGSLFYAQPSAITGAQQPQQQFYATSSLQPMTQTTGYTWSTPATNLTQGGQQIVVKQERARRVYQCFNCHGYGHFKADCPLSQRASGGDAPII
jgi:hypothetical protein